MLGEAHAAIRFDRRGPPHELLRELDQLARAAEEARQRRSKLLWRGLALLAYAVFGGPLVFLALVAAFGWLGSELSDPSTDWSGLMALVGALVGIGHGVLALVLAIWIFARRAKVQEYTLDAEKLACGRRLLLLAAADGDPTAPVQLFLDFAAVTMAPAQSLHNFATARTQHWLCFTASLVSKVTLRVDVTSRHKEKERQKPRYTKRKTSYQDLIDVRVVFRGAELPRDAEARIQPRFAYQFPRLMRCRPQGRTLAMRFATAPTLSVRGRQRVDQGLEQRIDERKLGSLVLRAFRAAVSAKKTAANAPPAPAGRPGGGTQLIPQMPG